MTENIEREILGYLADAPDDRLDDGTFGPFANWFAGAPEWLLDDLPDTDLVTAVEIDGWLSAPVPVVEHDGEKWVLVDRYMIGDRECPASGMAIPSGQKCPYCEEAEAHGLVYLGEGHGLVYALQRENDA